MKVKLDRSIELTMIGPNDIDLNQDDIRCELCGNLLTNERLNYCRTHNNKHFVCDVSCRNGLTNKLRMQNPEFKSHMSNLAKEQAKREYEDRSLRMKELNTHLWNDKEYENYRINKSKEFKKTIDKLWSDPAYRERHRENLISRNNKLIKEGNHNFTNFEGRCIVEMKSIIARRGKESLAYLYECENYDGHYKLGFTTDPYYRRYCSSDKNLWNSDLVPLFEGPVEDIALLECEIKLRFALRDADNMETYDFSQRKEIMDFMDNYTKGSTTIRKK